MDLPYAALEPVRPNSHNVQHISLFVHETRLKFPPHEGVNGARERVDEQLAWLGIWIVEYIPHPRTTRPSQLLRPSIQVLELLTRDLGSWGHRPHISRYRGLSWGKSFL